MTIRHFEKEIRKKLIENALEIMQEEVELLCERSCQRKNGGLAHHGGSELDTTLLYG